MRSHHPHPTKPHYHEEDHVPVRICGDSRARRYSALCWRRSRDASGRDLTRAAAIEPKSATVHQALGTLALYTGDTGAALREYREAVSLDPHSSSAHSSLGLLYRRMGRTEEALAELREALRLDPNNADARGALR